MLGWLQKSWVGLENGTFLMLLGPPESNRAKVLAGFFFSKLLFPVLKLLACVDVLLRAWRRRPSLGFSSPWLPELTSSGRRSAACSCSRKPETDPGLSAGIMLGGFSTWGGRGLVLPCSPGPGPRCGPWSRSGWPWCPARLRGCGQRSLLPSPGLRPSSPPYPQKLGCRGKNRGLRLAPAATNGFVFGTWPIRCSWPRRSTSSWPSAPARSPGWRDQTA